MSSYKVKFPIKTKLILIISMSFVITLTVIIFITSYFFRRDTETRIKESNHSLSGVIALKVKADFETLQQKAGLIGAALLRSKKSGVGIRNLFDSDKDLLFLGVVGLDKRKQLVVEKKIENKTFMKVNNISASNISHFINSEKKLFQKCMVGSKGVFNASPFFK
ncbi:MAG: hypothetical protein KAT05_10780, partial [Spirochaetes bacterium]|nr:hypothetical protein [Spirochaetota bacterium]